jgi:NADH:ubiquinone oxidoreductase subunit D
LNFGPAHPAAHGVFRLLVTISDEVVLSSRNLQGLLFRATESLLEFRNISLNSGYFARLDYVSFVAQEVGFSADKNKNTVSKNLLQLNFVLNHVLNLACTVADSGALGAILWSFEQREILQEFAETETGARLHVNLAFVSLASSQNYSGIKSNLIVDILLLAVLACKVSRNRLFGNFLVSVEANFATSTSS